MMDRNFPTISEILRTAQHPEYGVLVSVRPKFLSHAPSIRSWLVLELIIGAAS